MTELSKYQRDHFERLGDPELREARERIAQLEAALTPFAAEAADRDSLPANWEIRVPLKHLRAARDALANTYQQFPTSAKED